MTGLIRKFRSEGWVMADFWCIRKGDALVPDGSDSCAAMAKIPFGARIHVEAKRPRKSGHHRLYWGLCARIATAIDVKQENVSDILKIETGHCDVIRSKKYGEIRLPRSISFAQMDQTAFDEFFERCVRVIQSEWGIARQDVFDAVADLLCPDMKIAA